MDGEIPGYDYADASVFAAPIDMAAFEKLKRTVGWSSTDDEALRTAREVLEPQVDDILDRWLGFIDELEFMEAYRTDVDTGDVIEEYANRSRQRYGQWILDTCDTPYGQDWLDYQFEIGRRHHRTGKTKPTTSTRPRTSISGTSPRSSTSTRPPFGTSSKRETTARTKSMRCTTRGSNRSSSR